MKKKLVYIAPVRTSFPSTNASSLHMVKMCEAYSALGYEVTLITGPEVKPADDILSFYNVKHRFAINSLKASSSKLGNITYALKACSLVSKANPDKVVGRSVTALSMLSILGKKVTIDMHAPATEMHKVDQLLFKLANKKDSLEKITLNSHALKNIMSEIKYINKEKLAVAHNGSEKFSDYDFSNFNSLFEDNNSKINVGYFGSLYSGRGINLIISLANKQQDYMFHIFGGTSDEIAFWKDKCLIDNVIFYGHVSYKDTFFYRNLCDVLIAPYNPGGVAVSSDNKGDSSAYMNPIKLVEYLSAGKPIITSDIEVLKEILNQDCAIFCDYDDLNSWTEALTTLSCSETRNIMGNNSLSKFNSGFTWINRAEKLLK